jgi:hypothetical protein
MRATNDESILRASTSVCCSVQRAQRREARTEVVDIESDAHPADRSQHRSRSFGLLDDDAFGNFKSQITRRNSGRIENLTKACEEVAAGKLTSRNVDAHREQGIQTARAPGCQLQTGFVQDPAIDRKDQFALFCLRNELVWKKQPAARMVPANERLEPRDPAASQMHDRLIRHA